MKTTKKSIGIWIPEEKMSNFGFTKGVEKAFDLININDK